MIHFFTSGVDVGEVVVNRTNDQGCQFDVHFIQSQTSTDTSRIMNKICPGLFPICKDTHLTYC